MFRHDEVPPLQIRVASGSDWVAELEDEINTPFAAPGPLARFTWVDGAGGQSYVLVTLHHAVGDGMSGVFLMRDLIDASAQALAGQTPRLADLAEAESVDAGLSPAFRGARALGLHSRFLLHEAQIALRSGRPIRVRRDADFYAHSRRTRVIPRVLDAALSERLLARARAEKTTVHGALSAAMLLGTLADAGVVRGGVTFGSPVNVRSKLQPAVGEQLGFYVSMVSYRDVVDTRRPFWDLAREVRRQLETAATRGDALAMLDLLPRLWRLIGGTRLGPRALLERFERAAPATTGLTNLGRLAIQTTHGPLTIEDCHFAASPSSLGDFLASATSLQGRIFWNFVWPEPVLTQPHATALVDGIVEQLMRGLG